MEKEDTNISKDLYSPAVNQANPNKLMRNLEILEQVACGPIRQEELHRLCFSKKDPNTGELSVCCYSNMRRILKGLIENEYLRLKKYPLCRRTRKTQNVYVLADAGVADVCNHLGWEPEYIRRTFPRQGTLLHETLLSGIIRTIINEEAKTKRYKIDEQYDGRVYRKMHQRGKGKGLCIPDSYLSILPSNPYANMVTNKGRLEFMVVLDTGNKTGAYWVKKLKSLEGHNVLILSLYQRRKWELMGYLATYKRLPNVFFAVYNDFLQNGLTNTNWEHFDVTGNRELVKLPL